MKRSVAIIAVVTLIATPQVLAKTTTIRVNRDEVRAIQEYSFFRLGVLVWLNSAEHRKGNLSGISETVRCLQRRKYDEWIPRNQIHAIRFILRKAHGWKNRSIAILAGARPDSLREQGLQPFAATLTVPVQC